MVLEMLRVLEDVYENKLGGERICQHYEALQEGFRPRKYQPLMSRTKCSKFPLSHIMGTGHFEWNFLNFFCLI